MQKTFIFLFLILTHNAFTEVTPPNYNFNLKQLSIFFPGEKLSIVSKSYKNPILLSDIGEDILYQKYKIIHPNYTFNIYLTSPWRESLFPWLSSHVSSIASPLEPI